MFFFGDLAVLDTGLTRIEQIGVQAIGIVCISLWCLIVGFSSLLLLNRRRPLRVSRKDEEKGMNVAEHKAATEMLELLVSMKK
jgi:Amt family ammonium transporter